MTHDEVQGFLAAYALDATSVEESEQVEAHVMACPRCQAELAAHRETAALLATSVGGEPPAGLWGKIAGSTFSARPAGTAPLPPPGTAPRTVLGQARRRGPGRLTGRARAWAWGAGTAAGAAAAAFASFFGLQVGQLRAQVHQLQGQVSAVSIAQAAARAAAGPHATVRLAAPDGTPTATVVVAPQGLAYWVSSQLTELPPSETYQLWGLVGGKPVSLALLGPDPKKPGLFRIGAGTVKLMVTAEPAGGAAAPTTAVLSAGVVPAHAVT